jgi:hypothetical protein
MNISQVGEVIWHNSNFRYMILVVNPPSGVQGNDSTKKQNKKTFYLNKE